MKMRREDCLQHEMHQQFAQCRFVERGRHGGVRTGAAVLGEASRPWRGPCAATRSPTVLPPKSGSPASLASSRVDRAGPCRAVSTVITVNELVARAREEELLLAVLIDRPERCDRRGALAVLAEALGPELHIPAASNSASRSA